MRRFLLPLVGVFVSVVVVCLLAGCAGRDADVAAGTGTLQVKVNWFQARAGDKLIPASTQCLKLEIFNYVAPLPGPGKGGQTPFDTVLVPRQAGNTTTTSISVPVGKYFIVASAHATTDASDFPQAIGTTPFLTVELNTATPCSLTLLGAVSSLQLSPSLLMMYGGIGSTDKLTLTALDSTGNTIILSPSAGTWNISSPEAISVDADGTVTVLQSYGYSQVSYTDSEHNLTSNSVMVNIAVH